MNLIKAVVGANFGDEGKGLMTDFLVNKHQSNMVIRFNGGAQAGHTVETPDGRRHVFSHFGSGSFAGAETLLSRFFIVNPMVFRKERIELLNKQPVNLSIMIDLSAPVTTPFDMLLNQMVEEKRAGFRHGSCGLGIGETVERTEKYLNLSVMDLMNESVLTDNLIKIRDTWVPYRKQVLGLSDDQDHILMSDQLIENYLYDVLYLLEYARLGWDSTVFRYAENPIFEGAQGLLLDQDHEYFPHVTRSSTGIKNILTILGPTYKELEVVYATRAYLTRHGAGPFSAELPTIPFLGVVDETNIDNAWQGSLRFSYLDLDLLKKTIVSDLFTNKTNIKVHPVLAITCLDQCDRVVPVCHNGLTCYLQTDPMNDIGDQIAQRIGLTSSYYKSYGPTHKDVIEENVKTN